MRSLLKWKFNLGLLNNLNDFEIQWVMAKLGGSSARKYAKGFKKACIGAKFRERIAVGVGGFRDAILTATAPDEPVGGFGR